jgi:hypothetical protein
MSVQAIDTLGMNLERNYFSNLLINSENFSEKPTLFLLASPAKRMVLPAPLG